MIKQKKSGAIKKNRQDNIQEDPSSIKNIEDSNKQENDVNKRTKAIHENRISLFVSIIAVFISAFAVIFSYMQVTIEKDTAQKQLRAYLYPDHTELQNVKIGGRPSVSFRIRNGGQTPAYNICSYPVITYGTKPPTPDRIDNTFGANSMLIGNSSDTGEQPIEAYFTINQKMWDNIQKGHTFIFLTCKVTYDDIFGVHRMLYLALYYHAGLKRLAHVHDYFIAD